ncbi:MAG: xanthine dehydrogenase family protein molybdopterin-binding subunit [Myxococcales bacterium]|nr:xanthine dehydrogenase family protein molybdopterin-binding subunit [Myxococcales bacterium]
MSRAEVLVGLVGADATLQSRELPDGVPPSWRESSTLAVVGKPTQRIDGSDKVTGRARYTPDIKRPGLLHGKILGSPHPHARVHGVNISDAEAQPGVKAVVVLPHLLGGAKLESEKARGKLVPVVRYLGQPIAAVAAETPEQAKAALARIKVDFEVLPHVVDPDEALKPNAPLVFSGPVSMSGSAGGGGAKGGIPQKGNLRGPKRGAPRGKDAAQMEQAVAAALRSGQTVVRGTYRTQVQTHSALETHGLTAEWAGDELTVWASTQGIFSVRDELAEYLEIPTSKVRVITDFCGGGFGAKFGAGNYGVLAALLAKKAAAPVRVCLDRREEHLAVGNRPASEQNIALVSGKDGKLAAIELRGWGAGGAGAGAGFAGPANNVYGHCPAIYTEEFDVFTHTGPLAAFRAPGHPQGAFALEQAMDELAEKLGIDPLELRERNDPHPGRRLERQKAAELFGWSRRTLAGQLPPEGALGHIRRGLGMAQGCWYYFWSDDSHAEVRIHRDGTAEVLAGVQDIGTGVRTPLAQVVAEELGIPLASVKVSIGDTRLPVGPGSGGSVTTGSITPPARDAAYQARLSLCKEVAPLVGAKDLAPGPGGKLVGTAAGKPIELSLKQAAAKLRKEQVSGTARRKPDYDAAATNGRAWGQTGGVQLAEVTVDTLTGIIRVERIVAAHDCGRPLNPLLVESQIHGGIIQGISYALFEERRLDRRTGRMLNANLEQYKIAGALDVPRIDIALLEDLHGRTSTDARGIGEPATVPTAAAVANAVYNAIGVRLRELPLTPARVLAALAAPATGTAPR